MRKGFTEQTQAVQPTMACIQTDRQMDGWIVRGAEVLCGHHVLIWIWSAGQRVRMTVHGAPLSQCLPPLHTHTHFLAYIYTKEDGLNHGQESSHVHSLSRLVLKLSLNFPKSRLVFSLLLSQRPGSFSQLHHLPTGRERAVEGRCRNHLGPARRTFLPSGLSTSKHRPPLCFDVL